MRPRALVTGASRGIGAACAVRLAREGWDVAVHYHSGEDEAEEVAAQVRREGAIAVPLQADVGDPVACEDLVVLTVDALGGLDSVVANAGVYDRAHIEDLPPERWSRTISVNLSGSFHVVRAAVPHLRSSDAGSAVLVSSQLARLGSAHGAHYAASKTAIEGLTKALALELAPHGVRVNCVAPGMTRTAILDPYSDEELARRAQGVPVRRIGEVEDVASAVALLVSDDSSYMTGAVLHVNGGVMMA
ncbi:MAG: SDR family oxidoreductase [Thermoplasmata archaeon]|nr:MAG: SDR family oxidoreductase [Thermoplasmata archaeon]